MKSFIGLFWMNFLKVLNKLMIKMWIFFHYLLVSCTVWFVNILNIMRALTAAEKHINIQNIYKRANKVGVFEYKIKTNKECAGLVENSIGDKSLIILIITIIFILVIVAIIKEILESD